MSGDYGVVEDAVVAVLPVETEELSVAAGVTGALVLGGVDVTAGGGVLDEVVVSTADAAAGGVEVAAVTATTETTREALPVFPAVSVAL